MKWRRIKMLTFTNENSDVIIRANISVTTFKNILESYSIQHRIPPYI